MTLDLLLLGGTTEGRRLAAHLAGDPRFRATLSLAGRTTDPLPQALPTRFGGFGGAQGLSRYIADNGIDALVVATHPFAARIAAGAAAAAAETGVPALQWLRPLWRREPGDDWHFHDSLESLADALGQAPRRVFLTIGRQEAHVFERAPQHDYLVRSIEPIAPPLGLPKVDLVLARGPFDVDSEIALMRAHGTEIVVAKASGGAATHAKIEAARRLGLPVHMVSRPPPSGLPTVGALADVLGWLDQLAGGAARGE